MNFRFLLVFILMMYSFSFANVWDNKTNFENIINNTPHLGSIKCKFKQEKVIPNIDKPILSSGDFEFIENQGVYFYTNYPVKSAIDYTNRNYKQINDVIKAISSKKYKKLEKEFDFYFKKSQNTWIIGLKPKENLKSADFLSSITVQGSDYIKKIKIEMINGAVTTLWFEK